MPVEAPAQDGELGGDLAQPRDRAHAAATSPVIHP
jgi:hypothetical protein